MIHEPSVIATAIEFKPEAITEEWLKSVGFKWHQLERQPAKQWLLWLVECVDCGRERGRFGSFEDCGIELTPNGFREPRDPDDDWWFCWFRGDSAGRYHRFIHLRHLRYQHEVIALVEALSGRRWNPANHLYGSVRCQACGDKIRAERNRIDIRRMQDFKWSEIEKDDTRGRALPGHMEGAIEGGKAK